MKCKRVFILGFDGAGSAPKDIDTVNMDRVFNKGAYTYRARTAVPTISAECWGTMLHSVDPAQHQLTNGIVSREPYPVDSQYPSIFRLVREQLPDAKLAAFSEWAPINAGIIERNVDCFFQSMQDDKLALAVSEYLRENDPTLLFLELSECDAAGHNDGYFTPAHYEAVRNSDRNLGIVLDAIERENMWEDSLIFLVTDHGGGGSEPCSHGSEHPLDKEVYWGCCGPMICKTELKGEVYVADTARVAAEALGLKVPDSWIGKIPEGLLSAEHFE